MNVMGNVLSSVPNKYAGRDLSQGYKDVVYKQNVCPLFFIEGKSSLLFSMFLGLSLPSHSAILSHIYCQLTLMNASNGENCKSSVLSFFHGSEIIRLLVLEA